MPNSARWRSGVLCIVAQMCYNNGGAGPLAHTRAPAQHRRTPMAKPLIAVVNDETAFLELMHDLLADEGYETLIEKERGNAPQVIREKQPALVILDIRMDKPEAGMQIL